MSYTNYYIYGLIFLFLIVIIYYKFKEDFVIYKVIRGSVNPQIVYNKDLDQPIDDLLRQHAEHLTDLMAVIPGDQIRYNMRTGPAFNYGFVPQGALKETSNKYRSYNNYGIGAQFAEILSPRENFSGGGSHGGGSHGSSHGGGNRGSSGGRGYRGGGGYPYDYPYDFIGQVDSRIPIKEVNIPWEKVGIVTSIVDPKSDEKPEIMELYRRYLFSDLWEYSVKDKNGIIIPFQNKVTYLEDGDILDAIIGKRGKWKVHIFTDNKYIAI